MAASTQTTRKTNTAKGGSRSSSAKSGSRASGSKKGSASRGKQPEKRPIRREVWGVICLLLALMIGASYFHIQAVFLDWSAEFLKGLFGYGYYLWAPALLLSAGILLFHHGRPVRLRVACALLLPLLFGSLGHMVACKETYPSAWAVLKLLWKDGTLLHAGGAVSGAIAVGFVTVFSKVVSVIIFTVLFVVLLMVALRLTLSAVLEKARSRERLEYEYEEEPEPRIRVVPLEDERRLSRPSQGKPVIDIPLDDEVRALPEKKPSKLTGFFRRKPEHIQSPDELLNGNAPQPKEIQTAPAEMPAVMPSAPIPAAPAAVPPPVNVSASPEPELQAVPAPTAAEKKAKAASTAAEVAAATEAVTREIADKQAASGENTYQYPPITLLRENHTDNFTEVGAELRNNSRRLSETLHSFGVEAAPGEVVHGPSVTRYEFVLEQGVKLSKITNLADDIALALGASGVRIAAVPDKISVVGIEVPNKQVTQVLIRDVIESRAFTEHKSNVAFAVGKDIGGNQIVGNIAKLPHVLIAGTTGSGKSVCTNSLIISMLFKSTPDEVRFIMVDPKMVELAPYNGIPHLLIPVVTDPKKAAGALQWAVFEMMKRYKSFSENGVKDLAGYNALAAQQEGMEKLPSVVVVIDELADLMLVAAKEVEESICRVAQMGRAAGMHLVIATQRPSADVITGLMKANIPSRIAFAVASSLESRIILDTTGAEKLVGKGDMLYAPLGEGKPLRVQGCFISPEEIEQVVAFVKQGGEAEYSQEVMQKIEESMQEKEKSSGSKGGGGAEPADEEGDELLPAAVDVVLETGQASVSMLQRRLKLGYSRAARLVDQMEERGIVGPFEGSKPRQLLITRAQWQEMQMGGRPSSAEEEAPFPVQNAAEELPVEED